MARGGKRPGAGRKPNSLQQRTRAIAEQAARERRTPLEMLLTLMDEAYTAGDREQARTLALDAAPYIHPKMPTAVIAARDPETPAEEDESILQQYVRGLAAAEQITGS